MARNIGAACRRCRRENLKLYLEKMKKLNPSFLLLGEAPGYKGCRLTGIPFSSEKILATNDFFNNTKKFPK